MLFRSAIIEPSASTSTPSTPEHPTSWLESLPQDMRADPSLATIKDVPTLAKNYVETKRALGTEKIPKPQKNWGDKEYSEFYNALGRPENSEKYSQPSVKLDESIPVDKERVKATYDQFYKLGLTDAQAKGIMDYYYTITNNEVKAIREKESSDVASTDAALRKEWGQKYDMNLEIAKAAARKFGTQELFNKYGKEPDFISFLAKVGMNMMEDSATGRGTGELLPAALRAQSEINKLKADPDFMHRLTFKRESAAAAHWNELHRLAATKN